MPEEEKKQDLVDIDTSGPGAEVELEEEVKKDLKEQFKGLSNTEQKRFVSNDC